MIETLEVPLRLLRKWVATGSVSSAMVRGNTKGLFIVLQVGLNEYVVGAARGGTRYFRSMNGATSVLWQAGVRTFTVDSADWEPKTLKKLCQRNSRSRMAERR